MANSALAVLLFPSLVLAADESCAGFERERDLLTHARASVIASPRPTGAQRVLADHGYQVLLSQVGAITFASPPASEEEPEGFGGLLSIEVPAKGRWRVSVDTPVTIEAVVDTKALAAVDSAEHARCDAPRKVVAFALEAGKPVVLQLLGAKSSALHLAVTAATSTGSSR